MPLNARDKLCTIVTMPVCAEDYQIIKNFCEDHGIENVPDRSEMCVELVSKYGIHSDLIGHLRNPIVFRDFKFSTFTDKEIKTLNLVMHSNDFNDLWESYNRMLDSSETWNEEPSPYIVVSTDFRSDDSKSLEILHQKLDRYVNGSITFEEMELRYLTNNQIFNKLYNGIDPDATE